MLSEYLITIYHRINDFLQRRFFIIVFAITLALTFAVYAPGLSGAFAFDDNPNILTNYYLTIQHLDIKSLQQAAFSSTSGVLRRPVSMLTFAFNYYGAGGFDPYYFKLTNIFIHLINGALLFLLSSLVLRAYALRFQVGITCSHIQWISLVTAAAWLLHPLNLTGVLYVVQRMTSLSALFTLGGLVFYLHGRLRLLEGKTKGDLYIFAAVLVFLPLAVLSKENGILLLPFMAVIEVTLLNFETNKISSRHFLMGFYLLVIVLPCAAVLIYLLIHPEYIVNGYALRDFTLVDRLLTEPRILWFYLKMIVFPRIGEMGLFHDDIQLSHSLQAPLSTLFSIVGLITLIAISFVYRKRQPILAFGILFFLAGHMLESTVIPLEITFEHRNYLPMFGILLIVFYYALYPLAYIQTLLLRRIGAVLLLGLFAISTAVRANEWGSTYTLTLGEAINHPLSPRANSEMGAMYGNLAYADKRNTDHYYQLSRGYFEKAVMLKSNGTDGLFGLVYYSAVLGKPIERVWLSDLQQRLATVPSTGNGVDRLVSLATCEAEHKCKLAKEDVRALIEASLRNPALSGLQRAAASFALSYHLANVENDTPGALKATYQAMDAAPNEPEYRTNLIGFLIAVKNYDEARKQIESARKVDSLRSYAGRFDEQERLLKHSSGNPETIIKP